MGEQPHTSSMTGEPFAGPQQLTPAPATGMVVLTLILLLVGGFAMVTGRAQAARRVFAARRTATAIAPALALRIARAQRLGSLLLGVLCAVVISAFMVPALDASARVVLTTLPAVGLVIALHRGLRLHRFIRALRDPDASVEFDGRHYLFARRDDVLLGWLGTWPQTLERTAQQAMPTATLRR